MDLSQIIPAHYFSLICAIKDYQLTHGMLLKYGPDFNNISCIPVGVAMFPTPFPRELFVQACEATRMYSKLYLRVAEDEEWLEGVLKE